MQSIELSNGGQMNAGTIKIGKSGEIIFQFKNYHHIIDGETELCYAHMVERKINELNQALQKANEENERLKKLMSVDVIKIESPTDGKFELPGIEIRPGTVESFVNTEEIMRSRMSKCDELKDYSILDIEAIDDERYKTESAPGKWVQESRVYLKSEADKVIAELKDDVTYWKKVAQKNMDDNVVMARQRAEAFEKEHHHKYKRCLAMARERGIAAQMQHDFSMRFENPFYVKRAEWCEKWRNIWKSLADKFKEAK